MMAKLWPGTTKGNEDPSPQRMQVGVEVIVYRRQLLENNRRTPKGKNDRDSIHFQLYNYYGMQWPAYDNDVLHNIIDCRAVCK